MKRKRLGRDRVDMNPPSEPPAVLQTAAVATVNPLVQTIWDIISMIPRGQVATYGDVARAAGLSRGARQTVYALRVAPDDLQLPWHRVVRVGGRIAFPKSSRPYHEQARRLRSEGVIVKDGRIARSAIANLEQL
jgi:methylated-DNA-protein-cysteine methyltransferase-like protein